MSQVRIGYAFVAGRSQENARALLAAAGRAGYDAKVVKTTDGGYIVPAVVVDALADSPDVSDETPDKEDAPAAPPEETREADTFDPHAAKYTELKAEASRRGLSGAGTKDELIARLTKSAATEEG